MSGLLFDLLSEAVGAEKIKLAGSKHGGEYHSPCPVCGGIDRFFLFPEQSGGPIAQENGVKGTWSCPRHCHKGGDVISFCIEMLGMSFRDACERVGIVLSDGQKWRRAYRPLSASTAQPDWTPKKYASPSAVWQEYAGKIMGMAREQLLAHEVSLRWLASRGLPVEAIKQYGLGYLAGEDKYKKCLYRARSAFGLPPKMKNGREQKTLWIPRGITIPCYGENGQVLRVRIRRRSADLRPKDSKYLLIPQPAPAYSSPMLLPPTGIMPELTTWVVVESELDAMAVHYASGGRVGVVAILSVSGRPDAVAHAVLEPSARILVALDYDADKRASAAAWGWWRDHYNQVRLWPVPAGKDPGEAVSHGVDLAKWILAGLPAGTPCPQQFEKSDLPPAPAPPVREIPEAVRHLAELWHSLPIEFVAEAGGGYSWDFDSSWMSAHRKEWEQFMAAADAPEVWDWLDLHEPGHITSRNFLYPGKEVNNGRITH